MKTRRIKKCSQCKAALDASEFHRNLAAKDGLQGRCKQCHVKGNAKYRSGRKLKSLSDMGYKNALADMDQAFGAAGFSDHARDQCESAIRARGARAEREKWGREKALLMDALKKRTRDIVEHLETRPLPGTRYYEITFGEVADTFRRRYPDAFETHDTTHNTSKGD